MSQKAARLIIPWSFTGWFDEVSSWILDQLRRLNINALSTVKQVKSFYTAGTLRVETDIGDIYFKALPHVFVRELETTQMIAERMPDRVPVILAADAERRWMLQQDIGGVPLKQVSDIELETSTKHLNTLKKLLSMHLMS